MDHRLEEWARDFSLTQREALVLRHLVDGCTNKEIADRVQGVVGTIGLHVRAILRKTGQPTRVRLVVAFWRSGG